MPKKNCDDIAKENEELKKALKESVGVVERAQAEIDSLKASKDVEPVIIHEPCPHRKAAIYGVDENGVPYQGKSISLDNLGRPIFKVANEQLNKKLDEFEEERKATDALLKSVRAAIDSIPPEYLKRCDQIAREKNIRESGTVGAWDQERRGWVKELPPQERETNDLLAGAKIDVAGPRETFSSSKSSNWDQETQHWREGTQRPVNPSNLTVGSYNADSKTWTGRDTDKAFVVSRSSTGETSPPDKRCPEGIPKLGWGTLEVCKNCEYQIWCLKQIPKTQETASSNDYRHPTSTVCPHANEIPEDKMGVSAWCKGCQNNTYPYGNYCKAKKEASQT